MPTTKISEEFEAKVALLQKIQLKQEEPEQPSSLFSDADFEETAPPEKKQKTETSEEKNRKSSYGSLESTSSASAADKHTDRLKKGPR